MKALSFLLLMLTCSSVAGQVVLMPETEAVSVQDLKYLRLTDANAGVEQVAVMEFTSISGQHNSLGFDPKGVHWFQFTITNDSGISPWLAEVAYAPIDQIDLYYQDSKGEWKHYQGGDHFPLSARKVLNRHMVFELDLPHSPTLVYLRVITTSSIQMPVTLWKERAFSEYNYDAQFQHGIFYGIMLIMVFYNLFLYLSIRDKSTLYYIFTLLSGANVIAFFQGYGYYYLYPENPEWSSVFSALSGPAFIVSSIALTRSFLQLERFSFDLDRILLAVSIVSVLTGVSILLFEDYYSASSLHFLTILDSALILISASYCFYRKYRPARYFLLAWISLLCVAVLFSIRNMGYIQSNWFTNNALYFGGIMQTLLISFALGDRINVLKKENELARTRELEREHQAKEELEKQVQLRTLELQKQKEELEASNAVKDKLFSIVSHDLRGPLNSLKGTLTIWQLGALKPEELEPIRQELEGQLQQTSEFLTNLLDWAKSQLHGQVVKPERIDLTELTKEVLTLLKPEFARKSIDVALHAAPKSEAIADLNMVRTVLRNLLSNALKFTLPGGAVTVTIESGNSEVQVAVKDTGVGISPESLERIFTLHGISTTGTREEKGTGIGLVLCKEFVERNGGRMYVTSAEGKGSIFGFSLPAIERTVEMTNALE